MKTSPGLAQGLGLRDASALVVGTVIGTGIFLKTAVMSQLLGSSYWVFIAWIVAAVLSYAGALSYAELGSRFPKAGGEYAYIRETYGGLLAFLYGWTRFWIAGPGSIAAYAVGASTFIHGFISYDVVGLVPLALCFILFFTLLNCLSVTVGGGVQSVLTGLKLVLIFGIVFGVVAFGTHGGDLLNHQGTQGASVPSLSQFGAALIAALWAFDGWNNLPMVGAEVKNAQRTLPRALAVGMGAVTLAYLFANAAYFMALPFQDILHANSTAHPDALPVATLAAQTFLGTAGIAVMSVTFTISALGAMHGSVLTSARVPFAMSQDGNFPRMFSYVHPRTQSPVVAVLIQGVVACGLAISGSFDQLTDAVVFSSWIFYGLATAALFKLRRQDRATGTRPVFMTPGFPVVPALFVLVSIALLANSFFLNIKASLWGLAGILLGVPVYMTMIRVKEQPDGKGSE